MGRVRGAPALAKALTDGGVTEMLDFQRQPVAKLSFLSKLRDLFRRD